MHKTFTLAAAVAFLPVSNISHNSDFSRPVSASEAKREIFLPNVKLISPFDLDKNTTTPWSQNWLEQVQQNIRQSEYNFAWQENRQSYCAPNRKNDLRFFCNANGFSVEPRATKIPTNNFDPHTSPDQIKFKTIPDWKVRFNLDPHQIAKGKWQASAARAEYVAERITVQYINSEEGMRQNFLIASPLNGTTTLAVNFTIKTKLQTFLHHNQLQFFHRKSGNVLNYDQLKVYDAKGKILPASIKKIKRNIYAIIVKTQTAEYPITIDPLSSTPNAVLHNAGISDAAFGNSVASAGDVNGDGYSDIIVGAPTFDDGPFNNEGRVFVYHGSAAGIIASPANVFSYANQNLAFFGRSVASAGDVNGDGFSDVIIGANEYDEVFNNEGAAFVHYGSAGGLSSSANLTLSGADQNDANFGISVACAGDINGDGYSDVVIGAVFYDLVYLDQGVAYVYYGSPGGLAGSPGTVLTDADQDASAFGFTVACAGDVNGDGFSDVLVGAYQYDGVTTTNEGQVYVYYGAAGGLAASASAILDDAGIDNAALGNSIASAGDVNGDGYSDLIIGAQGFADGANNFEGRVFVYYGSASGLSATPDRFIGDANQANANFGSSVACAGDINGDGYSDVIIGAYAFDDGANINEGRAYVYFGSPTGLSATPVNIISDANQAAANFGNAVSSAGDVNGDGYSDLIIAAYKYDISGNPDEGQVYVYHGSADGLNPVAATTATSSQGGSNYGFSVASAGDVNADGYSDVIVGAWMYDNGQPSEGAAFIYHGSATGISTAYNTLLESNQAIAFFGLSVAGAGDVNADGYADVIVGCVRYSNGQTSEGAAFVFHGSVLGIITTPVVILEGNQVSAEMGFSVASAGDVNADGYSDVIVGARLYDNGETDEGAAFVFHGASSGVNPVYAAILESNQPGADHGYSVASAGDVNGDGFSDVIVGANVYDNGETNEGAAFVYKGALTGINPLVATMLESNQANAEFGVAVSSAGDVNGDGFGDVIVGAQLFDNGETDEGVAFIHHGSASGTLPAFANLLESNQAAASFGFKVSGAGDVNGDGYSDVIVGAQNFDNGQPDEGAAFIYHGSSSGLNAVYAILLETNQSSATLSAASASGDINGDGYSDIILGYAGNAAVYLGNNPGLNKHNNIRLYNTDLVTPINSSNFIIGNFGAGFFATSYLGKQKGKMVWETRLNFNAYSGTPITNSTSFTAEQSTFTDLGLTGTELKAVITKMLGANRYTKLRVRLKYDPATAITGQRYGPWRNVSSVIDGNHLGALPVELTSFKASWLDKGKTAMLNFTTEKEAGICCYEIEKSLDGFNFNAIGSLSANNNAGTQSYTFIDQHAGYKKQFYRIKMKGLNRAIEYSNVQQLQYAGAVDIFAFPNPATDKLQLQLNAAYDKVNILIANNLGQTIKRLANVAALNQTLSIDVRDLPAGNYWLYLQNENEKQVLQFVKR